nr:CGNR zinc finger domain-containing protein [Kineosporia babensis]
MLLLTQELANTQGPVTYQIDLLDELGTAQGWLDGVLEDWQTEHPQVTVPRIRLRKVDLEQLRTVRASVHRLLSRGQERLFTQDTPDLDAPVNVKAGPNGVEGSPVGTGIPWIASATALELILAQQQDQLRRLKLCHNPGCDVVFHDGSKNNSRAWHDVATCGNRANMRAFRERQRTAGA